MLNQIGNFIDFAGPFPRANIPPQSIPVLVLGMVCVTGHFLCQWHWLWYLAACPRAVSHHGRHYRLCWHLIDSVDATLLNSRDHPI